MEKIHQNNTAIIGPISPIWGKLGLLSFGGPTAQIALMHRLIVVERRWLNEPQFLNALSFCMLLPGPEAMQLAIYTGWRIHGVLGGLISGSLFVLPGALIMLGLAVYLCNVWNSWSYWSRIFRAKGCNRRNCAASPYPACSKITKKIGQWIIAAFGFAGILYFCTALSTYYRICRSLWFCQLVHKHKQHLIPISTSFAKNPRHYQNCFHMVVFVVGTIAGN